jgi:hypothetical protein
MSIQRQDDPMTQTTKDEAERIEAYVATAKRITMQARQLSPSGSHAWFNSSQEQIEADIYAALLGAAQDGYYQLLSAVFKTATIKADAHRAALKENEHDH